MKKSLLVLITLCGCVAASFFAACNGRNIAKIDTANDSDTTSLVEPQSEYTPELIVLSLGSATPTPIPSMIPTKTPVPTQAPVPTPFAIVWLADTQAISYHENTQAFDAMGRWIVEQKKNANVLYVVQTGDMVDNGFKLEQWNAFDICYNQFKSELPYFAIAGNHDIGVKLQDYSAYLARPNVSSIPRRNSFERGRAVYATFEAGGTKFLLLGAGWGSEEMSVSWMNQVLRNHSDYIAILVFHSYIYDDGNYFSVGKKMYEQVVLPNENVRLVLCGHLRGTGARFEDIDDNGDGLPDRKVTAMLYNYQDYSNNCGQLRILNFDPLTRSIHVTTFSPYTEKYYDDSYFHSAEFDLENAF